MTVLFTDTYISNDYPHPIVTHREPHILYMSSNPVIGCVVAISNPANE